MAVSARPPGSTRADRPARFRLGPRLEFPWRRFAFLAALLLAGAALLSRQIHVAAIHELAARIHGITAFTLLAVLPLFGFPASLLHVAAGIRFGAGPGLALVAVSILLQLLASYVLVHAWRERFQRWAWVQRLRRQIPAGAHASLCVFAVLLPGAPYAGINYVLPLIGVRFRTYLLCCLPLHTLRATVTVVFGDQSDRLTPARLAGLGAYALLILGASWWMFHRLRTQLGDPPAGAGDRTPPA